MRRQYDPLTLCFEPMSGQFFKIAPVAGDIEFVNWKVWHDANVYGIWKPSVRSVCSQLGLYVSPMLDGVVFDLPRTEERFNLITLEDAVESGRPCKQLKYAVEPRLVKGFKED